MQKQTGNPYPGFDETGHYYEPRPAPRVRPEAEEIASRNKGSIDLFNSEKHTHVIPPPHSPRCPTGEARQNYEVSRTGHVGNLLGGKGPAPPVAVSPAPRVTVQSEDIAEAHKGGPMNKLLTNYGHNRPSPRPLARVKPEAEETADMSKGGRMNSLMHNPSEMHETPRNAPRVKREAEVTAEYGKGASMSKIMGRYGETPRSTRAVPRVKPEAENTAKLDQGVQMDGLFHKYGNQPQSARPAPKVKNGHEIANLDKGGRMSKLMHEGNKLPSDPKPPPRAASSAGRKNIKKSRGNISNIFAETSKWQIVPTPGVRN
ncbi:uncharacterized protein LOC101847371 [Aplysia californica]|uniref:Uncharacterized protein LOC101847371 n=1 Tax=Aplysia californica TaxID=6500 RepID=A0ABM1A9I3_APLCA|nr:uncharacterized protein LOC101847371 [Aplysia californica]